MHRHHNLFKMLVRFTGICAFFGLICLTAAFKITPYIIDGLLDPLLVNKEPFVKVGDGYYYIESSNKKNWYAAQESCRQMNADLVSFNTAAELKVLTEYLKDNKLYGNYWTSGTDLAEEGKQVWFSNGQPIMTDLWYPGEPNNLHKNEHCFEMGKTDGLQLAGLNDLPCFEKKPYICQAPKPKTAAFIVQ